VKENNETNEIRVSFTKEEFIKFMENTIARWTRRSFERRDFAQDGSAEAEWLGEVFDEWVDQLWDEATDDGDLRE
jgi:hypothetical protein